MKIYTKVDYVLEFLARELPMLDVISDIKDDSDVEIVVGDEDAMCETTLSHFPNVRFCQYIYDGYDRIDRAYFKQRNIQFCNAKDIYSDAISEDVMAKLLYYFGNLHIYTEQQRNHVWKRHPARLQLEGKTIGILGTGSIGTAVAKRLSSFNVRILGYKKTPVLSLPYFHDIYNGISGLQKILRLSDVIIVAMDLNASTQHLLNKDTLSQCKRGAMLINIARGGIVEEGALLACLDAGTIGFAALDVMEEEPLPNDSPLWDHPHVLLTPHIASDVENMCNKVGELVIRNIEYYLHQETLINIVK